MKIENFVKEVSKRGLARQNRFEVQISNLFGDERLISLLCQSASLPGATIGIKKQVLFGPTYMRPATINYGETLQLSFLCDKDMQTKKIFDSWIHTVVNKSTFTVNYKSSYVRDVVINQLDERENITYSVKLVDAFPVQIGNLALNQSALDRFHILPVTLNYRFWETNYIDNSTAPLESIFTDFSTPPQQPRYIDPSNIGEVGSAPPGSVILGGDRLSDLPIAP